VAILIEGKTMSKESEIQTEKKPAPAPARDTKIDLDAQYKPIGIQAVSSAAEIQMHKHHDTDHHR
jgi:hypothetical protein